MGRFLRSPFVRLAIYYVVLFLVGWLLVSNLEVLEGAFSLERLQQSGTIDPFSRSNAASTLSEQAAMRGPLGSAMLAAFAIVGCLALLAPVVWVYMYTKQAEGYDESVVHTVIILPVAVTGLVIVVADSIALAFSLAGIVAAVRFRNTLKDTKDAVYIFLAIGTALAAGVQALGVAAVTSVLFNYLVLIMWRYRIGNIYRDQLGRTPKMRLADVLAGAGSAGAGSGNLTIGDPELLRALTPRELGELAARKSRLHERLSAERDKKFNGILIVYTDRAGEAAPAVESILVQFARAYELAEISSDPQGNSTLEYLIGLAKDVPASRLVATLRERASGVIKAAEFRSLKALRNKSDD